jgi:uncharacterized membrane protein
MKIVGVVLIVLGVAGLVWRGFSYTSEKQGAKLGPIEITVKEKKRVEVPTVASVVAVVAGTALLILDRKKR